MKKKAFRILGAVALIIILGVSGLWYYTAQEDFMRLAGNSAATVAEDALGVKVDVGAIKVNSLHDLEINDIAVYDKQAQPIITAKQAVVSCRLLAVLSDSPADAVKEVTVRDAKAYIVNRTDGTWNYEDLLSGDSSSNAFHGKINIENSTLTGSFADNELTLSNLNGYVDMKNYPAIELKASAENNGTNIETSGQVSSDRQLVDVSLKRLDLKNYLALIPAGVVPDDVSLNDGLINSARVHIDRNSDELRLVGQAEFAEGNVEVKGTTIEDINGFASFTEKDAVLNVTATANEQTANAHGKIKILDGAPYMDLELSSDSFDISKILTDIPYSGAASFKAKVAGTFANPTVQGNIAVNSGIAYDIPFGNALAAVRYQDGTVFISKLTLGLFGGNVSGDGVINTSDLGYTANIKLDGVDLTKIAELYPGIADFTGIVSADIGLSGTGAAVETIKGYGSLAMKNGAYKALPLDSLTSSFYLAGDSLTIDYLSANLPNKTNLGIEGSIEKLYTAPLLNLAFYGGHVDLALLTKLDNRFGMTGLCDFKGTLTGRGSNPQVDLKFSGLNGRILKQPFDSLKIAASGSLDGIHIDSFLMEKGGKETWRAAGSVGFTGDRKIDLQLDTMGARMEDIMTLVAPDQPLTGNVDNIIKLSGTLDNPKAVGYIHFYRGSYYGVLLSGMDGDYFLDNGIVRLQDFHAYSPMIDMVLNGTIDQNENLNLEVSAKDIDLKRVEHKLPYEVSGHGTFDGKILGNAKLPEFYGILNSSKLTLNGEDIENLHGRLKYKDGAIDLDEFGFEQNGGTFDLMGSYNTATREVKGDVVVQNADVNAITALINAKNTIITGRLNSGISLGGTIDNPAAKLRGELTKGAVAGHDVHDVTLELSLIDKILYIDTLSGFQGDNGYLTAGGTVDTTGGPMNVKFSANNLELAMFGNALGLNADMVGTADITADIGGYLKNPAADIKIIGQNGGVHGSTFDTLDGEFKLKNGLISVDKLEVYKLVGDKNYSVSAKGIIPSKALMAEPDENLASIEQIQLELSLDNADLSLLPTISNHVDWAMGATNGKLKVQGTLAHPLVYGAAGLTNGAVKIKELEKPITDMNVRIDFTGAKMTISDFSGKMGEGSYKLLGSAELNGLTPKNYDFSLVADNLDIQSSFFRGPLNGTLGIKKAEFFGKEMPKVSGNINFENTTVSVPSIPDSDGEMPEMLLDVSVNVGDRVHFYTPYLYDMYLTGAFHAGGLTTHPKMSGSLAVKRGGTINYLKTEFTIRQGVANFNQVASFLPSIDFFAETKLTQARVYLSARGPLGDMDLKLKSSPEMSQTQIIQLLTLRDAYKNGNTSMNAGDLLTVGLQMSFLSEVEGAMKDLLYLDQFTISRGSGSAFDHGNSSSENTGSDDDKDKYDFNIRMGKYIADKVMLKYTHGISGKQINRYGVQYDINDRLGLTLDREGNDFIVGIEARSTF